MTTDQIRKMERTLESNGMDIETIIIFVEIAQKENQKESK